MVSEVVQPKLTEREEVLVVEEVREPKAEGCFNQFFVLKAVCIQHEKRNAEHHQRNQEKEQEVANVK